jgi:hypothetical protein
VPGSRAEVAARLIALSLPGGPLDAAAFRLPGIDARGAASFDRARIRAGLVEEYLDRGPAAPKFGMAAVVTAGPPGAGKSAAVRERYPAGQWRVIDADIVKDLILVAEMDAGRLAGKLSIDLPDGHPVMPRECAGLVHRESVIVADLIRRRCVAEGENIVIEGTLGWAPHGPQLLRDLAAAGYERVDIVDVDVPQSVALERATSRWWSGRQAAISGGDRLGGRFTPPAAIDDKYGPAGESICLANARATFGDALAGLFDEIRLTVHHDGKTTTTTKRNGIRG